MQSESLRMGTGLGLCILKVCRRNPNVYSDFQTTILLQWWFFPLFLQQGSTRAILCSFLPYLHSCQTDSVILTTWSTDLATDALQKAACIALISMPFPQENTSAFSSRMGWLHLPKCFVFRFLPSICFLERHLLHKITLCFGTIIKG